MATASTSRHLAYNSPEPDTSSEDILPLAFDSEEELLSVFARLRGDLQGKTREKWEARGGADSGVELGKVEEVVLKDFFDKIAPIIFLNCTIAGLSYSEHQALEKTGATQPFNEELHDKVLRYQDGLFVDRAKNVNQRKEVPSDVAQNLLAIIARDRERLAALEAARIVFPEEREKIVQSEAPAKRRKSTNGARPAEGPDAKQAQVDFAAGKESIDRLLADIPLLSTEAESATQVAVDAANLM